MNGDTKMSPSVHSQYLFVDNYGRKLKRDSAKVCCISNNNEILTLMVELSFP